MADRQYSLKKANIQFTPLQGVEYKPMEYNMGYLADSLNRMEERERKATEEQSKLDVTFAKLKEQLHQDDETQQWFHDWEKKQRATIEGFAQLGDYSNAIKYASNMASSALDDGELQARIKTNQQYETWKNSVKGRNDVEQRTKDRLLADEDNQYKFNPIYDENDPTKVISGHDWEAAKNPVPHIDHDKIAAFITQYVPEESYSWNTLDDVGVTSAGSYKRKRGEAIDIAFNALLQTGGAYMSSLMQEYYDDEFEMKQLEKDLENPNLSPMERSAKISRLANIKEVIYNGSAIRDPISAVKYKIGNLLSVAAYDHKTSINKQPKPKSSPSSADEAVKALIESIGGNTGTGGVLKMSKKKEFERVFGNLGESTQAFIEWLHNNPDALNNIIVDKDNN